jgi:hypothetical protein
MGKPEASWWAGVASVWIILALSHERQTLGRQFNLKLVPLDRAVTPLRANL